MLTNEQLAKIELIKKRFDALTAKSVRAYQETEVRTNFIDPLFTALGWDMQDRDQVERESVVMDSKRPDYILQTERFTIPFPRGKTLHGKRTLARVGPRQLHFARQNRISRSKLPFKAAAKK